MITTYHISDAPIHEVKTWIRNNAHGKHVENYKNIEFDNGYKAITIERDKVITCVSTVYQRDFYPKKCVRIFNKWIATRKIGGMKGNMGGQQETPKTGETPVKKGGMKGNMK